MSTKERITYLIKRGISANQIAEELDIPLNWVSEIQYRLDRS